MRISKAPEERRAELVTAARALFDEKGVEKTRVSDIVGRVGVAQGVFYYYFLSKKEIVDEVVAQVTAEIAARRDAILAPGLAFPHQVAAYIGLYADWVDGFLGDGETSARSLADPVFMENPLVKQGRRLLEDGWVQLVKAGTEAGTTGLPYPEESALLLLYGLERLAVKMLPDIRMVYTLVEQGLGLPPGSVAAEG